MNNSENVEAKERLYEILSKAIGKPTRAVFYHYTSEVGLDGILSLGGLRAMHRWNMNDCAEFSHAKRIVAAALDRLLATDRSKSKELIVEIEKGLVKVLEQDKNTRDSRAYCACLSARRDDHEMWNYGDNGKGFALGFDMMQLADARSSLDRYPEIFLGVVNYVADGSRSAVNLLVEEAAHQYATANKASGRQDEVVEECLTYLLLIADFIKSEKWAYEEEFRITWIPNKWYKVSDDELRLNENDRPFLFVNMKSPVTNRLILHEILIGPSADRSRAESHLSGLLDKLGYGSGDHGDRPRIEFSRLKG